MKKCILFLLLTVSILMPMVVKADRQVLSGNAYAESATVGSNVVFAIKRVVQAFIRNGESFFVWRKNENKMKFFLQKPYSIWYTIDCVAAQMCEVADTPG